MYVGRSSNNKVGEKDEEVDSENDKILSWNTVVW